MTRFG
jgi:hypothetical protein